MEKIICPHCGKEIEVEVDVALSVVKDEPTPEPAPEPSPEPKTDGRLTFSQLLEKFNEVLTARGYKAVKAGMEVYDYMQWANDFTRRCYDSTMWMFRKESYPLVYDYRGEDTDDDGTAYNALTAWLMASELAELVPDSGATTNTQTKLYKLAWELGGGSAFPLYNDKAVKADPYAMREAASIMNAICRGDGHIIKQIDTFRSELGGKEIPATLWRDLGYQNEVVTDAQGNRLGYRTKYLGYFINLREFLPDAPGPRVEGTTVCELPQPWQQGQPRELFDDFGNYLWDEKIYAEMVRSWNMMSQTSLATWNSYSKEKQNRLVQVGAIPRCTKMYWFSKKNVRFDGIQNKCYNGQTYANYFCFSETSEETGLALDGPFSDLSGIWRYNAAQLNARESFLDAVSDIADNMRFSTQDPNYGRCRPGCKNTLAGGERNPVHGAAENEIYNIDLTRIVADNDAGKSKAEDGFAADSPRSYVSGHSSQIWLMALLFIQMNNDGGQTWIRKAYEYSVSRSIGRFHWMSDCIYGRLVGAMTLPIVNAMTGLKDGYEATRQFVLAPEPAPEGDWAAKIIVKNQTGKDIQSTGEIRLYVGGHEYGINTYLPGAAATAGAKYTFKAGENDFSGLDVHCEVNGGTISDSFNGMAIDSEARFYDYRHYNNKDAGYSCTLDTSDPRCDKVLKKAGGTYVVRITKL